jgi:hypothetical protein
MWILQGIKKKSMIENASVGIERLQEIVLCHYPEIF